jgi:hypothetical protein
MYRLSFWCACIHQPAAEYSIATNVMQLPSVSSLPTFIVTGIPTSSEERWLGVDMRQ